MTGVFTKYGKAIGDVQRAILTLKAYETQTDAQAAFAKNSVDHSAQVQITEANGVYTLTATILLDDYGTTATKIQPEIDYYVGAGIVFSGENSQQTAEPDEYVGNDQVRFLRQRVDTIAS